MADTQEFNNLVFDASRFSDELMEELHATCPSQIKINGRALIIKHCYVERRMNPLNLYLQEATDEEVVDVMNDYGNAIKDLAAANIFPGDMLLKNFGVTRHGRVVFYDYETDLSDGWEDEIIHNNPKELREKALKMGANIISYAFLN